jgi:hypothetical protein
MGRRCYTATVERIAMGADSGQSAFREYVWLHGIVDGDGTPFVGERWLNHSMTLQRLNLHPGDRIRFEARTDAFAPDRQPLGRDIDDPAAFLAEMAAKGIDTEGVTFRLIGSRSMIPNRSPQKP